MSDSNPGWQGPSMSSMGDGSARVPRSCETGSMRRPVLALLLAIGLTAAVVYFSNARQDLLDDLAQHGVKTTGSVTGATERTRKGIKSYSIEYEYRANGTTYAGSKTASREQALGAGRGDAVAVTYSPSSPTRSIATTLGSARQDLTNGRAVGYVIVAGMWLYTLWAFAAARA
jgi:Protein of unknown function (DUF3592)